MEDSKGKENKKQNERNGRNSFSLVNWILLFLTLFNFVVFQTRSQNLQNSEKDFNSDLSICHQKTCEIAKIPHS